MKMVRVTVFLGEDGAGPSVTYMVVAANAREAVSLVSDYLSLRHPWMRLDVDMLTGERGEGPPRVLGLVSDEAKAQN